MSVMDPYLEIPIAVNYVKNICVCSSLQLFLVSILWSISIRDDNITGCLFLITEKLIV